MLSCSTECGSLSKREVSWILVIDLLTLLFLLWLSISYGLPPPNYLGDKECSISSSRECLWRGGSYENSIFSIALFTSFVSTVRMIREAISSLNAFILLCKTLFSFREESTPYINSLVWVILLVKLENKEVSNDIYELDLTAVLI